MCKALYTAGEMTVKDYEDIYDAIVALSIDAEGFALDGNYENDEEEKVDLILQMIDCLNDVPLSRANWIVKEQWKK